VNFANLGGHGAANFFTRRYGRSRNRIGSFEAHPHGSQVGAASPTKLARLTFL
jgi:hypothetical protein